MYSIAIIINSDTHLMIGSLDKMFSFHTLSIYDCYNLRTVVLANLWKMFILLC